MEAKELRLFNYIYDRDKPVDLRGSQLVNIIQGKYIDDYKPILLNEDWLVKFGFIIGIKSGYNAFVFDGYCLIKLENNYEFLVYGSSVVLSKIKYVHQLQNIYFALTGEELTINKQKSDHY